MEVQGHRLPREKELPDQPLQRHLRNEGNVDHLRVAAHQPHFDGPQPLSRLDVATADSFESEARAGNRFHRKPAAGELVEHEPNHPALVVLDRGRDQVRRRDGGAVRAGHDEETRLVYVSDVETKVEIGIYLFNAVSKSSPKERQRLQRQRSHPRRKTLKWAAKTQPNRLAHQDRRNLEAP